MERNIKAKEKTTNTEVRSVLEAWREYTCSRHKKAQSKIHDVFLLWIATISMIELTPIP